jgi:hypothetical protein
VSGLNPGTIAVFDWRGRRKPRDSKVKKAGGSIEILLDHLPHTSLQP